MPPTVDRGMQLATPAAEKQLLLLPLQVGVSLVLPLLLLLIMVAVAVADLLTSLLVTREVCCQLSRQLSGTGW